jgi:hypothetical protein
VPEGRPNVVFFPVDHPASGELICYSGGPFRRSALPTGRHADRLGTHSGPIGRRQWTPRRPTAGVADG